jgi:hypothetical protein
MKLSSVAILLAACMVAGAHASPMVGGAHAAPVSEEARQAAHFAAQQLSAKPEFASASNGLLEVDEILAVRTQVVAGLNYYITMNVKTPEGLRAVDIVVWRKLGNAANGPSFQLTQYSLHANKAST